MKNLTQGITQVVEHYEESWIDMDPLWLSVETYGEDFLEFLKEHHKKEYAALIKKTGQDVVAPLEALSILEKMLIKKMSYFKINKRMISLLVEFCEINSDAYECMENNINLYCKDHDYVSDYMEDEDEEFDDDLGEDLDLDEDNEDDFDDAEFEDAIAGVSKNKFNEEDEEEFNSDIVELLKRVDELESSNSDDSIFDELEDDFGA